MYLAYHVPIKLYNNISEINQITAFINRFAF